MGNDEIKHGVKVTTGQGGSTNMGRVVAVNIGTPMSSKTRGTKDTLIMVFIIALKTLCPYVKSKNLLRGNLNLNETVGTCCNKDVRIHKVSPFLALGNNVTYFLMFNVGDICWVVCSPFIIKLRVYIFHLCICI